MNDNVGLNEHKKHRERLRRRFLSSGLEGFEPHEVLELLLYYAIPQQDTNPVAHRLIECFGSVSSVMDADPCDLTNVDGIKEYSAVLLKLIPEICSYYQLDKVYGGEEFSSIERVGEYCVYRHIKDTHEILSVMVFNDSLRLLCYVTLSEGSNCTTDINLEALAEVIFRHDGCNFILVHNHPGGVANPSEADIVLTQKVYSALLPFNKILLEHIVVAGNRYVPIRHYLRQRGLDIR